MQTETVIKFIPQSLYPGSHRYGICLCVMINRADQCLPAVRVRYFPDRTGSLQRAGQSVIHTFLNQRRIGLKDCNLFPDFLFFFRRHLLYIQFIAECTGHRHAASCGKRGDAPGLMIGHRGNMGTHGGNRITERSAILNTQPFYGVCCIAAPNLRHIIQYPGVKPTTAAATAFKQNFREIFCQRFQYAVQSQNISVGKFPLSATVQQAAEFVTDCPVKIPFYISHRYPLQQFRDCFNDIRLHISPGKIQHKLVSAQAGPSSGNFHRPFRMAAV